MLYWPYYTFNAETGTLIDDNGNTLNGNDCKPAVFGSASEAETYLEANDIRGTVR